MGGWDNILLLFDGWHEMEQMNIINLLPIYIYIIFNIYIL